MKDKILYHGVVTEVRESCFYGDLKNVIKGGLDATIKARYNSLSEADKLLVVEGGTFYILDLE